MRIIFDNARSKSKYLILLQTENHKKKYNLDSTTMTFTHIKKSFIKILDNHTLIFPEFKGNGVMASLGNIYENPQIGLMFIDFFSSSIGLHVNGKAEIITEKEASKLVNPIDKAKAEKDGQHKTKLWIKVKIEEAYIHCSKHIPKLKKQDKIIHWGTDDEKLKGGDFFKTKGCDS